MGMLRRFRGPRKKKARLRRRYRALLVGAICAIGIFAGIWSQTVDQWIALALLSSAIAGLLAYASQLDEGNENLSTTPSKGSLLSIHYSTPDRPWADWLAERLGGIPGVSIARYPWTAESDRHETVKSHEARSGWGLVLTSSAQRRAGVSGLDHRARKFAEEGRLLIVQVEDDPAIERFAEYPTVRLADRHAQESFELVLEALEDIGGLSNQEVASALGQAFDGRFPGDPPPICNAPSGLSGFVGRSHEIDELYQTLLLPGVRGKSRTCALYGFPGVGKTSLAKEFVERYGRLFGIVWWVSAELLADVGSALRELAAGLGIPLDPPEEVLSRLWEVLGGRTDWLLVFDNVEDLNEITTLWPPRLDGHVLLTSRYRPQHELVDVALRVDSMRPTDAVELLLSRTGSKDVESAQAIADELGLLPLALGQAASYVAEGSTSLSHYLNLIRQRPETLRIPPSDPRQHAVAETLSLSLAAVGERAPQTVGFMTFFAFAHADDLPRQLLAEHASALPDALASVVGDPLSYDHLISTLANYSLIKAEEDRLDVHRLVQVAIITDLAETQRKTWAFGVVHFLAAAFPEDITDSRTWHLCNRLLSHLITAAKHIEDLASDGPPDEAERQVATELCQLFHLAGGYLVRRSSYELARQTLEECIRLREQVYGHHSEQVAEALIRYGELQYRLADLPAARDALTKALAIDEERLGADHPALISNLVWLGQLLREEAKFDESLEATRRAASIATARFGDASAPVADITEVIGLSLWRQGHLKPAINSLRRAVQVWGRLGDPDPALTAVALRHQGMVQCELASALTDRATAEEALTALRTALARFETAYGDSHFETASVKQWISVALSITGDLAGARTFAEEAFATQQVVLGHKHPSTAGAGLVLAHVLVLQGDTAAAVTLAEQAREIFIVTYGSGDHPYVAEAEAELGAAWAASGEINAAASTLEHAVAITTVANPDHPKLIGLLTQLAEVLGAVDGQAERAASCRAEADRIRQLVADEPLD